MLTTSVNCNPPAVDPSPYDSENVLERDRADELALGLYNVAPEQFTPHPVANKKKSLLPVSKNTASYRGSHNGSSQSRRKVIPEKDLAGVPTETVPDHNTWLWLTNGSPTLARRESGILPERGCGLPVFLSYVASPS
jgi:hypothetical protein